MSKPQKHQGPGRADRQGISLLKLTEMFPDEAAARQWFEAVRWAAGRYCGHCGSTRTHAVASGRPMPYRCSDCRKYFSVRTGTPMQSSRLPLRKWVFAMYLMTTSLKGVSSMKLHRDLEITQKTAWYLGQRIRRSWDVARLPMAGPVEVDETYVGGTEKTRHADQKRGTSGVAGKAAVVGIRDRQTNRIAARPVARTDRRTLHGFIQEHAPAAIAVYTDDHPSYRGLPRHYTVKHSAGEYVPRPDQRTGRRKFLGYAQAGAQGSVSPLQRQALASLRDRIRGPAQRPGPGYHPAVDRAGRWHDRQGAPVCGPDCRRAGLSPGWPEWSLALDGSRVAMPIIAPQGRARR